MNFDPDLLLWAFFYLGLAAVVIYGFSLIYHWVRFGYLYPLVWLAIPVYVIGTIVFIGAMLSGIAT